MTRKEEIVQASKNNYNEVKCLSDLSAFPIAAFKAGAEFGFREGAEWADKTAWKPADGDNLPEIDREVIAIIKENDHFKVAFAHRPPEYWDGRNIITNEVTRNYTKRYDKGKWNQPNVKWWLDLELPKMEMEKL